MRVLAARRSTFGCLFIFSLAMSEVALCCGEPESVASDYFPPPESRGGCANSATRIRSANGAGMDPDRLTETARLAPQFGPA